MTTILIVVLIAAILIVGLLWYKQKQENNVLNAFTGLGLKALGGL